MTAQEFDVESFTEGLLSALVAPPEANWLTAADVASWTRLHVQTVRRLNREGRIPGAVNVGTPNRPTWRYDPKEVAAWLTASRQKSA